MTGVAQPEGPVLCRAAAGGDRGALGLLLERYQPALWPMCYRGTGGHLADAEDVLQETFYRAVRGIATYDPERPLEAWLKGIAARVVADLHRGRKARPEVTGDATDGVSDPTNEDEMDASERLNKVLREIEPVTRAILLLRYSESFSWDEIAQLMGMTREAVKKRLLRGKAALRAKLTGERQ